MIETKLNNLEINELTEEQYKSAKESGVLNSDAFYMTPSAENVSDVLPVIKGGTNAKTAGEARINLGFEYGEEAPTHIPETGDGAIYFKIDDEDDGVLSIEEGGTNAVTGYDALTNLGLRQYMKNFIHPISDAHYFTSSTSLTDIGYSLKIPANSYFCITASAVYSYGRPAIIILEASNVGAWSESPVANNGATATLCAYTEKESTITCKCKYANASANYVKFSGYYINFGN